MRKRRGAALGSRSLPGPGSRSPRKPPPSASASSDGPWTWCEDPRIAGEAGRLRLRGARLTSIGVRRSAEPGRGRRYLSAFWHRAYEENITGLAAMVAYNLVLALFPFALLVLFIFGRILQSPDAQSSVLSDLQRLFPAVEIEAGTSWKPLSFAFNLFGLPESAETCSAVKSSNKPTAKKPLIRMFFIFPPVGALAPVSS